VKTLPLFFCILILSCLGPFTLKAQGRLYIKAKDGSQSSFLLPEIRTLSFTDGNLVVTPVGSSGQSYPLYELRFLSFRDYFTGIPSPVAGPSPALILYPDPAGNEVTIVFRNGQDPHAEIELTDIRGRVMFRGKMSDPNTVVDVSGFQPGMYLCRLMGGPGILVRKFIKK
jgi:hypothetical protein